MLVDLDKALVQFLELGIFVFLLGQFVLQFVSVVLHTFDLLAEVLQVLFVPELILYWLGELLKALIKFIDDSVVLTLVGVGVSYPEVNISMIVLSEKVFKVFVPFDLFDLECLKSVQNLIGLVYQFWVAWYVLVHHLVILYVIHRVSLFASFKLLNDLQVLVVQKPDLLSVLYDILQLCASLIKASVLI